MIATLKSRAVALIVSGLSLLSAFLYWQHVTIQRDAFKAEAERQQARAEILLEHQEWQREQIETLNAAMAERDRTLTIIADDMRASTAALEQLGETNAEARDWLDGDRPSVITDWVRELQRSANGDAVPRANDTRAPDYSASSAAADTAGQ